MDNDLIYHYTTADGLRGITCEGHLRMTNVLYLNDSSEMIHGIGLIKGKILEELERMKIPAPTEEVYSNHMFSNPFMQKPYETNQLEKRYPSEYGYIEILNKHLFGWIDYLIKERPFYTVSFCTKGNLLRQWSAYCPKGGYSIGFNKNKLKKHVSKMAGYKITEVDYSHNEGEIEIERTKQLKDISIKFGAIIDDMLRKHANQLIDISETDEYKNRTDELFEQIEVESFQIAKASLSKKSIHFRDEEEVRIIRSNAREIDFYKKNNILVPYAEYEYPKDAIEKIYIGPMNNQDLAAHSLRSIRSKQRMEYNIEKSEIPLRAL